MKSTRLKRSDSNGLWNLQIRYAPALEGLLFAFEQYLAVERLF
jgi:hypothetical protein